MIFSDEDKILIKKLYQLKGYNARQLRTEFPDKGWTTSSITKKFKHGFSGQTTSWHAETDCEVPARVKTLTRWTIMVLSKHKPRTYSTVREISRKTAIPKSSVAVRIIYKRICSWNGRFKMRRAQELTDANCTAHKLLLKKFSQFAADFIFFTDERCSLGLQQWKIMKIG